MPPCSVGYLISAILICIEYLYMGLLYRSRYRIIFVSFGFKLAFIIIEIALAIAWVCMAGRQGQYKKNASAVIEWGMTVPFP